MQQLRPHKAGIHPGHEWESAKRQQRKRSEWRTSWATDKGRVRKWGIWSLTLISWLLAQQRCWLCLLSQRAPQFCHLNRGKHNSTSGKHQSGLTFYTTRESLSVPAMLQIIWPPAWLMSNSSTSHSPRALVVLVFIRCFSSKQLLPMFIYLPVVGFRHVFLPKLKHWH